MMSAVDDGAPVTGERRERGDEGVAITLDLDWAPDFAIDAASELLIENDVRATWFVTHDSAAVRRLRERPDLFELGLHPNFLPGSSHGSTVEEVLTTCMELAPAATSMRTHGLYQSSLLLESAMNLARLEADASLFVPGAKALEPSEYWSSSGCLVRVPYVWEDDVEMCRPAPAWDIGTQLALGPGLKVLDFHPIHVFLNSSSPVAYQRLKQRAPRLQEADESVADGLRSAVPGAGTMFNAAVGFLAQRGGGATITEIARARNEVGAR